MVCWSRVPPHSSSPACSGLLVFTTFPPLGVRSQSIADADHPRACPIQPLSGWATLTAGASCAISTVLCVGALSTGRRVGDQELFIDQFANQPLFLGFHEVCQQRTTRHHACVGSLAGQIHHAQKQLSQKLFVFAALRPSCDRNVRISVRTLLSAPRHHPACDSCCYSEFDR